MIDTQYAYVVSDWCEDEPRLYRSEVAGTFGKDRVALKHSNGSGVGWRFNTRIDADRIYRTPEAALLAFRARQRDDIKQAHHRIAVARRNLK